jgi:predicted nuclease of restriction endonuclease-like (RecB) superfamily
MKKAKPGRKNTSTNIILDSFYVQAFERLKDRIYESRRNAALSVNQELIKLYWDIGNILHEKQKVEKWGTGIIERLVKDIQNTFPGIEGFSRTNLFRMRLFYLAYQKVAQTVPQLDVLPVFKIPWGHNIILLQKLDSEEERVWYAEETIKHGWSRHALEDWIKSDAYKRQGKAITNFEHRLPEPQSKLAKETLKDPYKLDFLSLTQGYREQELEQGLIDHIEKFLLELGSGFAFIGRQYHLEISGKDYYLDLIFFHTKLRCYVVVELKNTEFKPEHTGQLNFYLSIVDDKLRHPEDKPTIGILLCKTKDNLTVEYALRDVLKPIGVASYETQILDSLPKEFKGNLPTVEELERELIEGK